MVKSHSEYYKHLQKLVVKLGTKLPGLMSAFGKLHSAAVADGALNPKVKELIALGIAVSVRCHGCVSYHVHDALGAGATREEILETVGVAILMGGGSSVIYGCEALEALEEFETEGRG